MKANGRYMDCEICEKEIEVWGADEFNWIDGSGPYCDMCNQWMSRIDALQKQVDELVDSRQRDRGEAQRRENIRRASPYDASIRRW